MKKISKILVGILALSVFVSCLTVVPSMAATTTQDAFVFVPVVTGDDAFELFSNSTADGGDDADISLEDGVVTIEYPMGVETAESTDDNIIIERKQTEVDLDLTPVSDHKYKYVSFDIEFDSYMDMVITPEPYNVINNLALDTRPHSLFVTNNIGTEEAPKAYMVSTIHTEKGKYSTTDLADGYKPAITGSWWTSAKHARPYTPYEKHNVKFIISALTGVAESDEVQIYIDGTRAGQTGKNGNYVDSWIHDTLRFSHWATQDYSQIIYLSNIEMGYCDKAGMDEITVLDHTQTSWNFPEGQNTFISVTVPATTENAFGLQSSASPALTWQRWTDMSALAKWWVGTSETGVNGGYDSAYLWPNQHIFKEDGTGQVTITFEKNTAFKTLEVYDSYGHWGKIYYTTEPTYLMLLNMYGTVQPTKVVAGAKAWKGSSVINTSNGSVTSFDENTGKISMSEFGVTEKNKGLLAMYAWYNASGVLIDAETMPLKADADGVYCISPLRGFGSTPPAGAVKMRTFLWDGTTFAPIRTSNVIDGALQDITDARVLGRTELTDYGYSLNWVNSGIEYTFEGTETSIYVNKTTSETVGSTSWFTPYVDGVAQDRVILKQGWNTIASGLEDTTHTIKFVRSSEARDSRVWVMGMSAENIAPTEPKSRMIEFYGDSYSAGYGNMGVLPGSSVTWGDDENSDAQKAFPALVADYFDADLSVIAHSGKGVIRNGANNAGVTIPAMAFKSDIIVNGDTMTHTDWDFASNRAADLVVIFLGTNDAGYAAAKSEDITDEFISGYKNFVGDIRSKYADAKILCVGMPEGSFTDEVEAAVEAIVADGDDNVSFYRLQNWSATAIYAHPSISEYEDVADELNAHISTLMGWE